MPRDSVRRDAHEPARPSHSGTPIPSPSPSSTRGTCRTVCGGVVDGIQLRIPQCEEDNLEALGEFIENVAVGHLTEKKLFGNRRHAGEVVSSVGDTKYLRAYLV